MPHDDPVTQTMQAAVEDGVFPGAVLFVRHHGHTRFHRAFGHAAVSPVFEPASVKTVYDLASLTKPLATATAILCLVQDGRLTLDVVAQSLLPELKGSAAGAATVFHLLNHSAGLPGWKPLYERIVERDREQPGFLGSEAARRMVLDLICGEPPVYPVGTRSLYSDLGFILLGLAVERLIGCSLAAYCRQRIYEVIGARPLFFLPCHREHLQDRIDGDGDRNVAPTEEVSWRGRMLRAEVHDDNAYALGGIAGHAGLFGTAAGVAVMSGLWLDSYLNRRSFLSSELVRLFVSRQGRTPGSSWGLGWDTPSAPSSSGQRLSSQAFGHLGFTGMSIWLDPACELEIVLLSNRVHPTKLNTAIQAFRPTIHDVIYEHVVDQKNAGEP